ncbi:MAG: hypothetical protein Q4F21_08940 [Lachnospiraceae bacterium]|nr:hypothetical protein [Lachnospiraceae bacterium]
MKKCICMLMLLTMVAGMSLSASAASFGSGSYGGSGGYGAGSYGDFSSSNWFQNWFNKFPDNGGSGEDTPSDSEPNKPSDGEQNPPSDNESNTPPDSETQNFPAPQQVTVTGKTGTASREMHVSWEKVENAAEYITQLATNAEFTEGLRESTVKGTSILYTIQSGVGIYYYPAHRTYYIRVKAIFKNGESKWSKTVISEGN